MTPVLMGRIQTRLFVLGTVGVLWTLIITPFLLVDPPGPEGYSFVFAIDTMGGSSALAQTYKLTFAALAITAVFGCIFWDPLYHFLMQFRWEKDWPAFFHLLSGIPEGISTFLLLHVAVLNPFGDIGPDKEQFVPVPAYIFLFSTTWIITWLAANGPMKIFFIRWRFFGGRLI
jgi:hypothetical protein